MSYSWELRNRITDFYQEQGLFDAPVKEFVSFAHSQVSSGALFHVYSTMSPIENMVYGDIREHRMRFLPEFKIGKYYADFANPVHRVVIEADGKQHEENQQYDAERDQFMSSLGWDVYRIKGKDTFHDPAEIVEKQIEIDPSDKDQFKEVETSFMEKSSYGLVRAINFAYGYFDTDDEELIKSFRRCMCIHQKGLNQDTYLSACTYDIYQEAKALGMEGWMNTNTAELLRDMKIFKREMKSLGSSQMFKNYRATA